MCGPFSILLKTKDTAAEFERFYWKYEDDIGKLQPKKKHSAFTVSRIHPTLRPVPAATSPLSLALCLPRIAGTRVFPSFNQPGVSSLCELTSPISPPEDSHLHGKNLRWPTHFAMKLLTTTSHTPACIHSFFHFRNNYWGVSGGSVGKDPPASAGNTSSIPRWGRSHVPQSN